MDAEMLKGRALLVAICGALHHASVSGLDLAQACERVAGKFSALAQVQRWLVELVRQGVARERAGRWYSSIASVEPDDEATVILYRTGHLPVGGGTWLGVELVHKSALLHWRGVAS